MIGFTSKTPISETNLPSDLLNHAYVLPKFTNVDMSLPSSSNIDSKTNDDQRASIFQKMTLLEKLHKADLLRIEQLERQVKDLMQQLETMKQANKSLLEEKGFDGGELHALYQNLFITDMKQQMTDMSNDISRFRSQKEQLRKEYESVKKENGQLQATIKRYRVILSNALKKPISASVESVEASSVFSGLLSESDKTQGKLSDSSKKRLSSENNLQAPHGLRLNMVTSSKIEKLNLVLLQLNNCTNVNQLCKVLTRSTKALTKSQKVSIYLISNKTRENYVQSYSGSPDFIGRVRLGNIWIIMHTHKDAYQEEPMFKKLEELKYPVRHADLLLMPIVYDREISFVIQGQDKKGEENKSKVYTPIDELMLKIVGNAVVLKLDSIFSAEQEKLELNHSNQVAQVATRIISSLSHRDIANRVRDVLPHFFDFENAGIVFIDNKSHQFYVMIHDPSSDDYFGDGYLRFPFGIGLTGQAISRDGVSVFNNPKTIPIYNPEIDNVGWVHETKTIVMGCLKDWNGNLIGIIQLTNKKYGEVAAKDVKRLESMLELLGTCVATTNLTVEHFSLTIKFKAVMEKITKMATESEKNAGDAELNSVVNQITNFKNSFNDWVKTRKTRFL
jgi:regulator of replication initiation timing